jgi:hypothetical protein
MSLISLKPRVSTISLLLNCRETCLVGRPPLVLRMYRFREHRNSNSGIEIWDHTHKHHDNNISLKFGSNLQQNNQRLR